MPQLKMQLPQIPDVPWQDSQYKFSGAWMPGEEPALIGPENFATLTNLRYTDNGLEGVSGYTNVNSTAITDHYKIRNGHQLTTPFTTTSYTLCHGIDADGQGAVIYNTTAIGSQGNFTGGATATNLHEDAATNLKGRFSDAPQGHVVYCNGKESTIWAGTEKRASAIFLCSDSEGSNLLDSTDDINSSLTTSTMNFVGNLVANGRMETASTGWTALDAGTTTNERSATSDPVHSGTYSWKMIVTANGDGIKCDAFTMDGSSTYTITAWVYSAAETAINMEVLDGDGSSLDDTEYTIVAAQWNKISVDVDSAASGSSAQIILTSGTSGAGTWFFDDVTCVPQGANTNLIVMTTRPAKGFKFYMGSGNFNATAATMSAYYWNGSAWTAVSDGSDGTSASSKTLAQDGSYTFTDTVDVAKPKHFEELYLYAYMFTISDSAANATIYQMTVDCNWQDIVDVWDGVYRQPIQFQVYDADHYEDYTLHVNESSDVSTPIGGILDGLLETTDYVITMFQDQLAGMKWTMLGNLISDQTTEMTVQYWNGIDWEDVTGLVDGTRDASKTKSAAQTGLISWNKPSDEQKQTLFGTVGYAYKIKWDDALGGTKNDTDDEVVVDLVYGVPASKPIQPFDFSVLYKNRVMLGSFSAGSQRNRMDFCATNAPDVWNGYDASDDGKYSLYFGNESKITSAIQLYNRFGSNIFSMLLVLKEGETYILTGDTPDDFQIFPVSLNTGCPAPLTLATAEMGFEAGAGVQRQVAMWVSHSGPMMFDGAVMQPIKGIENYFDRTESEYVNWDYMYLSNGWVDHTMKEYNLLIPSGASSTSNNVWLVYDLVRKKWFRKNPGTAAFPQSGWNCRYTTGRSVVYSGFDNGKVAQQEEGYGWACSFADPTDGTAIAQTVKTGDFFPTNNIWDDVLLRKFKLICEKVSSDLTVNLTINYFGGTANSASSVVWQDANSDIGTNVDWTDYDFNADDTDDTVWAGGISGSLQLDLNIGTTRLVRVIQDMDYLGWSHSFEFSISTSDVPRGWKPVIWGLQFRVERKDNTAT